MSNVIDSRVVEMQFDNSHFERNVSTTMSTLDKLKQSLNLSGAAKGFEDLGSASRKVDLSGIGTAVDTVQAKFSALGVMGVTALANITNSAVNAGKRIVSALTIDPIKTGFQEYETQIGAVQTILANTKSKGTNIDDVNKALDELNLYADKTIYNFTEMTRNIGTFTAAGVDLDTSVSSIKGIANLAAVSGSTSQQASTAMYQLSQALAAGKVQLMDWNSVVNAGMGGELFQDALKRTARNMGTNVDAIIKKYGSFRESLSKGEWLTAEVLTETLSQLAGAYTEADLLAKGYTQEQAAEILDLAKTAEDAATKVKTFTQLWDTLKESAQSGWSQTWEILVGDFEEAKETLTKVSDVLGEMIGNSANARNELLQGWKDAGGRDSVIASVANAFQGIMNIATPIKEAFRDIFPPLTVEQLLKFTEGLENLTVKFKEFTGAHADDIRSAFEGVFSVLDIGWTLIKDIAGGIGELIGKFSGLGGNIFETAGSLGEWLSNLRDTVKENDIFGQGIDKVVGFLSKAIDAVRNFGQSLKESFQSVNLEGFFGFFEGLWNVIQTIGSKIGAVWKEAFSGDTNFMNIVNSGLFAGILAGIQKFAWGLSDLIGEGGVGGMLENITGILDDVRGCFEAYQNQLNAGTLQKIAVAIGILAASLFVIAKIDPEALDQAVGAITVLFAELLASMGIFGKITPGISGVAKAIAAMLTISISIGILAAAMSKLGSLEWEEIGKGLVAVGGLMAELLAFMALAKIDGGMTGTAFGIVLLSTAMLIMAKAVEDFGSMDWSEIGKGLAAIGGLLAELAVFSRITGNAGHVVATGVSMVLLGASLKILASAMKDFGGMNWAEIGKGLAAMGGALLELTLALNFMPQDTFGKSVGLIAVGAAMLILANAFQSFGGMDWSEIGKGLVAMGGALAELAIALNLMNGTVAGSAALLVAAAALTLLVPVMTSLGGMTWGEIAKGLITIAGAFAVIGVAGLLLGPLVPTLISLAGAMALFGVSVLAIGAGVALLGAGLTAIGTGIGALGTGLAVGATAIAGALSIILIGLADAINALIPKFGEMILGLCDVIVECAPAIAETILIVVDEVLKSLVEYGPSIVDSLLAFFIEVINTLATRMPELNGALMGLIGAFFGGMVDAIKGFDSSALLEAILGVGLFVALLAGLSAIAGMIPGAMLGVLGMGAVIAELALVLAAVGLLAQIPGLNWLIEEGGGLLQNIGNALGGFIGGIVGGFAEGVTASLPQIGTDLSDFMTNLQPFIEGAKQLDASMMESVKMLAETILLLTAADLVDGITSWLTGGSSLSDFGNELADFATSINEFATNLGDFDETKVASIECAAKAITAMATAADAIPNEGGWAGKIFGENSIAKFGEDLPDFATNLNDFATNLGSFDDSTVTTITSAANAIKAIADVADTIPDEGGWAAKIFGDNSIAKFGEDLPDFATNLNDFATNLGSFDDSTVTTIGCAAEAIKAMALAADAIPNEGGWVGKIFGENSISAFGEDLASFGSNLRAFVDNLGTFTDSQIETVRSAMGALRAIADLTNADIKGGKKHLGDFGTELVDFAGELSTFCSSLPDPDTISAAADSLSEILVMMNDITGANSSALSNFTSSLKSLGTDGVKAFVDTFTNSSIKSKVKVAAENLASQAVKGVESKKSAFKDACAALAEGGASGLEGHADSFFAAGANLAIGFANGISANSYLAAARARAMALSAKLAAEAALGIESPSKVFYKIGDYTGMGFINALDDYASKAYNTATGLAISARSGLADTISNLASVIDGDMDIQPTIRPVLDLSDVRSGVGSLSGMLNGQSSIGVMANVGAISATMARRNQNGVNDDVISAIDKLRKDLPNVGGTTYSINGITYDDGSNIASAIKTITRHVKIEGRV